jgi:predicted membrane-bound spermidine synthase
MKVSHRYYLYCVVFISGMTSLAIELSASRLLGNVFGTSNLVWASIIGLILLYLTLGYFLGGKLADRKPFARTLYIIMAWGAFTTAFIPFVARPILRLAADAFDQLSLGVLFGSFFAVLVLFVVPVTLIGTASPYAIRLLVGDQQNAGSTSGQVYAISTLGSFVGAFLPVLLLIPLIGTTRTFLVFGAVLLLAALLGLVQVAGWRAILPWLWMPVVLILLAFFSSRSSIKSTAGQIYEQESAYNYIQVLDIDGYRYLRLNEGQGVHSMWHPTQLGFNGPWEQFLVAPFFNSPDELGPYSPERVKSMAIIGLAAGTAARQASAVFGPIPIDGYEIDPAIIEVGRKYFGMNEPNLDAIAQDGRWGLAHSSHKYSIVAIDAYRPPYIPWHLTTQQFFQIVHDHLTTDGTMVINVGNAPGDRRLVDGLASTIRTVFPSIYIMDVPDTFNSIIYATLRPTQVTNLYKNLLYLFTRQDVNPLLVESIQKAIVYQQPVPKTTVVFTDDLAPVEWITNSLVLKYVFSGETENLK